MPWTEEPGRLQSMELPRVGHNWATLLSLSTFMHWTRKWQPTPVFLPGESQGWQSLVGCRLWGRTESDTTEATQQQQQRQQQQQQQQQQQYDCSLLGFPVLYHLLEFAQTHVHWVNDAIQTSHSLLPSFPPALNLFRHQDHFQSVDPSHHVAKVLELQLQCQSFQWIFKVDFL